MFDISLLDVWISDETLLIVFNILPLGVRISDETLVIEFDILLLSAWKRYLMKQSFWCFTYYFGYYRRNNFSRVGNITYRNLFYGKATTTFFCKGPVNRKVDNVIH